MVKKIKKIRRKNGAASANTNSDASGTAGKKKKVLGGQPSQPEKKKTISPEHLAKLQAAREARLANKPDGPTKHRTPYEVWKDNPTSLRKSVNAMCYTCCGEEMHISRIKHCTVFSCPLWPNRPYSKGITQEECLAYVEYGAKEADDSETDESEEMDDDEVFTDEDEE